MSEAESKKVRVCACGVWPIPKDVIDGGNIQAGTRTEGSSEELKEIMNVGDLLDALGVPAKTKTVVPRTAKIIVRLQIGEDVEIGEIDEAFIDDPDEEETAEKPKDEEPEAPFFIIAASSVDDDDFGDESEPGSEEE